MAHNRQLSNFPTQQATSLQKIFSRMRRRLDENFSTLTISNSTTATEIAALTAPTGELDAGSILNLRVSGTILNDTGASTNCTVRFLLGINGLGIHDDVTVALADPGTAESVAFVYDARIYYRTPTAVTADGSVAISADGTAAATVGTGTFDAAAGLLSAVFSGSSTSADIFSAQRVTLTATLGSASASFTLSKLQAVLWAE